MARYTITLPGGEAVHVDADKLLRAPGGDLLIFGASGNPNGKPDVIPQGEWQSFCVPFVASKRPRGRVSGKAFAVRADTRNKRKDSPVKKRGKRKNALVSDLTEFIRSYVVMSEAQTLTVALWVIHTHCYMAFEQTPYLIITSPEKQCGKSRLLEVLDLVSARPWQTVQPSEAVLFRQVQIARPTMLWDEIDTVFNPRTADRYEGHRAMLNAGHRNGAEVPRCVGPKQKIQNFPVFCPKALAGIGSVPDTVADRGIPLRLARKKPQDEVQRFRRREVEPAAQALRERIEAWTERNAKKLVAARPDMPEQLSDRMVDGCEPLVAIADALGYGPPSRAALVELLTAERLDSADTMRIRLLRDIRSIFESAEKKRDEPLPGLPTMWLLERLHAISGSPWRRYYGERSLDDRDMATLLGHYGIESKPIRRRKGELKKGQKEVFKGYKRDDLADVWERYL